MNKNNIFFRDGIKNDNKRSESIDITINENIEKKEDNSESIMELMKEFENIECEKIVNSENYHYFYEIYNYDANYSVRDLGFIYEYYYGVKKTKGKKVDLIIAIVLFENNLENFNIVEKRKKMWKNIQELKADKYMKRFVLWG